jgi:phospholipase D1/2
MRPAPTPNEDEFDEETDQLVADPLADSTQALWNDTARKNREVFTELFRPVPTNLVREWKQLDNYAPQVKTGHVIPGVPLERVKQRLGEVRGTLVEMAVVGISLLSCIALLSCPSSHRSFVPSFILLPSLPLRE